MGADFLTIAGIATSALSTVAGVGQSIASSQAASAQAAYQSQVAANNAEIARQNERLAQQEGEAMATAQGLKDRATMGAILAGQAAAGVDVNRGSPVDIRSSAAQMARLDALTIKSRAAREAFGYRSQAGNLMAEAGMLKRQSKQSSALGVMGSLLGGAASVTGKYLDWQSSKGANTLGMGTGYLSPGLRTTGGLY